MKHAALSINSRLPPSQPALSPQCHVLRFFVTCPAKPHHLSTRPPSSSFNPPQSLSHRQSITSSNSLAVSTPRIPETRQPSTQPTFCAMADRGEQPYDPYIPQGGHAAGSAARDGNTRTAALQQVGDYLFFSSSILEPGQTGFRGVRRLMAWHRMNPPGISLR